MSGENSTLQLKCFHCGDDCDTSIHLTDKYFCCNGCKVVYEILNENQLCDYYNISDNPGISQKKQSANQSKFDILTQPEVKHRFIEFTDGMQTHATFYLPQIHCSSCIWLLENMHRLNEHIISSRVNFSEKKITIVFNESGINLTQLAVLLAAVGYEPHISLNDLEETAYKNKSNNNRVLKIGIAGFCFGNIMMLAFPDYFSGSNISETGLKSLFSYLSLGLSLPVFFYCAQEFFTSAFAALKQKFLNIDAPIALAIVITFARSIYEILSGTGNGYLDSMSGIVFFMLIGRLFQDKSYKAMSFERNYKSYFPISFTITDGKTERQIPLSQLKVGDRIIVRNNELICADAILFKGKANIDYSFVSGESVPVERTIGEILYAGGKQIGGAIELEIIKEVSQSYLTQLWNNSAFEKKQVEPVSFIHKVSTYFSYVLFSIAFTAAAYWFFVDPSKMWNAFTATLIVACPCALLLSATFTNGTLLHVLGTKGLFLKNAGALESLSKTNTIVFDKTGTVTTNDSMQLEYHGSSLSVYETEMLKTISSLSSHPYSMAICSHLKNVEKLTVDSFQEYAGKGTSSIMNGFTIKLGSAKWLDPANANSNRLILQIENNNRGYFIFRNTYRKGFESLVANLQSDFDLHVLSGDNDSERQALNQIFNSNSNINFNQSPENKLNYIKNLQTKNLNVLMLGDGLNDAGALAQSNCGIAVTENINNFSPACDAILTAEAFPQLNQFIQYAKAGKKIIIASFIISICYNLVGIYFAVNGILSPVIAAILMPISTISIVAFTTGTSTYLANKLLKSKSAKK
jgi:Cu+-exporting ATPase